MEATKEKEKDGRSPTSCCQAIRSFLAIGLIRKIVNLSWPVVLTFVTSYGITLTTFLCCGRLGSTELAAAALAISFANATGMSVAIGLSTAFDTLCSQAIGANQMKKVGVIIQRGLWIMGFACLVVWGIWLNSERLMIALDQDLDASSLAAQMCDILSIGLPSKFLYITVQKYLQTQGLVRPVLWVGLIVNILHIIMSYILLFVLESGVRGAALSVVISETCFFLFLLFYIKWTKVYKETWPGWTQECLYGWGVFAKVALAGLGMICIEWCSFEVGAFLVGSINKEELGAFAIILQISTLTFMLPIGIALSSSILVGQYLGSGRPDKAKHIAQLCLFLDVCLALTSVCLVYGVKDYIGFAFTDDRVITELASKTIPVFIVFHLFDSLQGVAGGIIRGCGLQHYGILFNFIDYNIIGIPLSVVFALVLKMNNLGFWLGLSCGIIVQFVLYITLLLRTDWSKLSKQARKRAGITSTEQIFPITPVGGTDCITVARSVANLAELSKPDESTERNGPVSPDLIPLTMIKDTKSQDKIQHLEEHEQHKQNTSKNSSKEDETSDQNTASGVIEKERITPQRTRISTRLKIKRVLTMLVAVLIWCVGVIIRLVLPPIVHSQDSSGLNDSNFTMNLTSNYSVMRTKSSPFLL